MAAQISIKMALGTFFQLVNIANRFLRFFSKLDTPIRSIFPRVRGYPIFRLDYMYCIRNHVICNNYSSNLLAKGKGGVYIRISGLKIYQPTNVSPWAQCLFILMTFYFPGEQLPCDQHTT